MAAADFNGKWKLEKNDENFDNFLKKVGVNMIMRTAASKATPVLEITQNGDEFTVITKSAIRTQESKFKMGEEFTAKDPMVGKEVKMMASWDGGKQVIKPADDPDGITITREIEGDKLIMTQTKGDVATRRTFGKIE